MFLNLIWNHSLYSLYFHLFFFFLCCSFLKEIKWFSPLRKAILAILFRFFFFRSSFDNWKNIRKSGKIKLLYYTLNWMSPSFHRIRRARYHCECETYFFFFIFVSFGELYRSEVITWIFHDIFLNFTHVVVGFILVSFFCRHRRQIVVIVMDWNHIKCIQSLHSSHNHTYMYYNSFICIYCWIRNDFDCIAV